MLDYLSNIRCFLVPDKWILWSFCYEITKSIDGQLKGAVKSVFVLDAKWPANDKTMVTEWKERVLDEIAIYEINNSRVINVIKDKTKQIKSEQ